MRPAQPAGQIAPGDQLLPLARVVIIQDARRPGPDWSNAASLKIHLGPAQGASFLGADAAVQP